MKAGNRAPAAVRKRRSITDRSALLYEYSRYVYDHSIARFGRVDQKAAGMLSTSVIVIGVVFGLGSEWIYADLTDHLHTIFSLLSWFFAAGILISAGLAIGSGIAALKISEIETPPLHEGVLDYMLYQPLVDSHTGAATTLLEANRSITEQLDRKGRNVERAVIWTIVLIAFSAAAFLSSMIRSVLV